MASKETAHEGLRRQNRAANELGEVRQRTADARDDPVQG